MPGDRRYADGAPRTRCRESSGPQIVGAREDAAPRGHRGCGGASDSGRIAVRMLARGAAERPSDRRSAPGPGNEALAHRARVEGEKPVIVKLELAVSTADRSRAKRARNEP